MTASPRPSPTDEEVERVARAICQGDPDRIESAQSFDKIIHLNVPGRHSAMVERTVTFPAWKQYEAQARAAIAAMSSSPQIDALIKAAQWQPIETAPRDGTWFMICNADEGYDSYEVGRHEPLISPRFVEVEGGLYRKEEAKLYDWRGFNNFHRATHWMPLPAAPFTRQPQEE